MDNVELFLGALLLLTFIVTAWLMSEPWQCNQDRACKYKEEISFCEEVHNKPFASAHRIGWCDIVVCGQWGEKVVERFCGG